MDKGIWLIGGITVLILGAIMLIAANDPKTKFDASLKGTDAEVVSESGIHWHPELAIYIKGQRQDIAANIGISPTGAMGDIHTHKINDQLHYEIAAGPVKKGSIKLARFFEAWRKPFNKDQILDARNGEGGTLAMTVNGQVNTEYENYLVKDGDKIEIRYE